MTPFFFHDDPAKTETKVGTPPIPYQPPGTERRGQGFGVRTLLVIATCAAFIVIVAAAALVATMLYILWQPEAPHAGELANANVAMSGWYIRSHIPGEIMEHVPQNSAKERILLELVDFFERHIDGKKPFASERPRVGEPDLSIYFTPQGEAGNTKTRNRKGYVVYAGNLFVEGKGVFSIDVPFLEEMYRKLERYSAAGSVGD
jgi:hypothetical protein